MKDLTRLADIARQETGAVVGQNQHSMLESRLSQRMSKLGISDIDAYWLYFAENEADERRGILSLMTTHHTFFFREFVHFEALEHWIDANAAALKKRFSEKKIPLKIWSAACSRGHEVYSLAMFLEFACFEKHGIPFEVIGTDIDPDCIAYAQQGMYSLNEINKIPQKYLTSFFGCPTGVAKGVAQLNSRIKDKVKFEVIDLLKLDSRSDLNKADVIFIRNVFIYFSAEQVQKVALLLSKLLIDGGLFVSGVSEPIRFPAWDLQHVGPSIYTKKIAPAVAKSSSRKKSGLNKDDSSTARPRDSSQVGTLPVETPQIVTQPSAALPVTTYRVLCVDDSPTIQAVMKHIFSRDKNCTDFASAVNGLDARKKLDMAPEGSKFDIMTLDIHMPVMGGIEFLETSYRPSIDPPVLMISSVNRADLDLATKALALGAADYVEKPSMNKLEQSSDEILAKIKMILKDRRENVALPQAPTVTKVQEPTPVAAVTEPVAGKYPSGPMVQILSQGLSQKILIPDASQCMRWIKMNSSNFPSLKYIFEEQKRERRSPAMVLSVPAAQISAVIDAVFSWTKVKPETFLTAKGFLRANVVYVCDEKLEPTLVPALVVKNFSLQILCPPKTGLECFGSFHQTEARLTHPSNLQVLLDESLGDSVATSLKKANVVVSEITPSTSFVSLSLEFFAYLRRLAS